MVYITENTSQNQSNEGIDQPDQDEETLIKVEGRKGVYREKVSTNDKYAARPKGVENLTLSQF